MFNGVINGFSFLKRMDHWVIILFVSEYIRIGCGEGLVVVDALLSVIVGVNWKLQPVVEVIEIVPRIFKWVTMNTLRKFFDDEDGTIL